uniref:Uncharacterized protein n=1 Tax=Cebus imitator TaxID=2715852 RepID=A0A2K5R2P2_CEBIM
MFILSDGEGKNGSIELMEPLDEEISGIGRANCKAAIMCASYVQFKEDNQTFNLGLYNEAPLEIVQHD